MNSALSVPQLCLIERGKDVFTMVEVQKGYTQRMRATLRVAAFPAPQDRCLYQVRSKLVRYSSEYIHDPLANVRTIYGS